MLAPHHGKDAEFGEVRLAPEDFLNLLELFPHKAVLFHQFGCNNWIARRCFANHRRPTLPNSRRPLKSMKWPNPPNRRRTKRVKRLRTRSVRLSPEARSVEVNLINKEASE